MEPSLVSVNVPVQSSFTVYVPVAVPGPMLPFWLILKVKVILPFPSKYCTPTSAYGPHAEGGIGAATSGPGGCISEVVALQGGLRAVSLRLGQKT